MVIELSSNVGPTVARSTPAGFQYLSWCEPGRLLHRHRTVSRHDACRTLEQNRAACKVHVEREGQDRAGQFNSRFPNEADGLPLLLGEGFAGGARFLPGFADQVERGVAERGEGLGC